jgi:hypothetical protein
MRWPWGRHVVLARAVAGLAPMAFLLIVSVAGTSPLPAPSLLVGGSAAAVLVLRYPDSVVPTFVWGALGAVWLVEVGQLTWWATLAAAVTLLGHCATAFVAGAPPDAAVDRALAGLWAERVAGALAVTAGVAGCVTLVSALRLDGSIPLTVTALLGVTGWVALIRVREDT